MNYFISLIPALFGLFFIVLSIYLMRNEYIFAKKQTVLTHARLVSVENLIHTYQYRAGNQTFTFPVHPRFAAAKLSYTYPVRYLVEDPQKHEAYIRPGTETLSHRRFNWFKYILMMLVGIFFLYAAVQVILA